MLKIYMVVYGINVEKNCALDHCGTKFADCLYGNLGKGKCSGTFKLFGVFLLLYKQSIKTKQKKKNNKTLK